LTNWIANKPGSIREDGGDIIYKGYIMAGQRYQWMGEVKKLKLETMFLTATIGGSNVDSNLGRYPRIWGCWQTGNLPFR